MKNRDKKKKKKREMLKDMLKKRVNKWNPRPAKSPASNTKTSA
ncbi:hypothetical protein [Alkalihalobacillus sp. CinArs1]|nr:hypothetical protein [Alkalihalobacillus sp. CinArs1]